VNKKQVKKYGRKLPGPEMVANCKMVLGEIALEYGKQQQPHLT
jgi:hypothetical protein